MAYPAGGVDIIEPAELAAKLPNDNLLLVQVTSPEVYLQAHIEGAVLVTPGEIVSGQPPASGRLPDLERLEALFARLGYTPEMEIVVYDDEGGGWAGRFGWTLDVIGKREWQYLNGGLQAWHHAGLDLQQGEPHGMHSVSHQVSLSIDTTPIAEISDILECIEDPNQVVWDVRSAEEYNGQRQAAARVGHIPGAVNLDWMALKDPAAQMRLTENIEGQLESLGLTDKALITHCQTHHRSGLSYMLGRILGLDIRAYHGSWSEWGNREDTPIEH